MTSLYTRKRTPERTAAHRARLAAALRQARSKGVEAATLLNLRTYRTARHYAGIEHTALPYLERFEAWVGINFDS